MGQGSTALFCHLGGSNERNCACKLLLEKDLEVAPANLLQYISTLAATDLVTNEQNGILEAFLTLKNYGTMFH